MARARDILWKATCQEERVKKTNWYRLLSSDSLLLKYFQTTFWDWTHFSSTFAAQSRLKTVNSVILSEIQCHFSKVVILEFEFHDFSLKMCPFFQPYEMCHFRTWLRGIYLYLFSTKKEIYLMKILSYKRTAFWQSLHEFTSMPNSLTNSCKMEASKEGVVAWHLCVRIRKIRIR